ncbi:hypothetical protein YC2023_037892 [Brassica napus]
MKYFLGDIRRLNIFSGGTHSKSAVHEHTLSEKPRPHNTLYDFFQTNDVEESICPEPNGATRSGTIDQRS